MRRWFTGDRAIRRREASISVLFQRARDTAMLNNELSQCFVDEPFPLLDSDALLAEPVVTINPLFELVSEPLLTPIVDGAADAARAARAFALSADVFAKQARGSADAALACAERLASMTESTEAVDSDRSTLLSSAAVTVAQGAVIAADKAAASCDSACRAADMAASAAALTATITTRESHNQSAAKAMVNNVSGVARSLAVLCARAATGAEEAAKTAVEIADRVASMENEGLAGLLITRL